MPEVTGAGPGASRHSTRMGCKLPTVSRTRGRGLVIADCVQILESSSSLSFGASGVAVTSFVRVFLLNNSRSDSEPSSPQLAPPSRLASLREKQRGVTFFGGLRHPDLLFLPCFLRHLFPIPLLVFKFFLLTLFSSCISSCRFL